MLSRRRYEADADMAAAARDAATDDEVRYRLDQAWAAHATAARHALFAERWAQTAAGERQAAAQEQAAAIEIGRGRVMTVLEERALESEAVAGRHRAAAEACSALGHELQANGAAPAAEASDEARRPRGR